MADSAASLAPHACDEQSSCGAQFEKAFRTIIEQKKQRAQDAVAAATQQALDVVADSAANARFFVVESELPAATAGKALPEVAAALRERHGERPCLLAAPDGDAGKCLVYAEVPKTLSKRLGAREWLNAALAPLGGKGGGKPERAQGSGPAVEQLAEALRAAEVFAEKALG